MLMTFEKIEAPPEKTEHPAARAAKLIRSIHQENLAMMDGGMIFMRDGVNVNEEMRAACEEQIAQCNVLIARAEYMDPKLFAPSMKVLSALEAVIAEKTANDETIAGIPEIGNYDHGK